MAVSLSSIPVFAAAVAAARTVDLASYTLRDGAVRTALVLAARSGAHVRVRLERDPVDDPARTLHRANAAAVAALLTAGADAGLSAPGEPVLHMKAAVVDGVAWLDDRNWAGGARETILEDTAAADVAVLGAVLGGPSAGGASATGERLATTKAEAQALEVGIIRAAGPAPVAVESESFGSSGIYNALLERGRAGYASRLLVAGREAAAPGANGDRERNRLGHLAALGVEIRTGDAAALDFDEKLAVTPASAWAGSANATYARGEAGEQRDWGLVTREPVLVDGLRAAFERNWDAAHPLGPPAG